MLTGMTLYFKTTLHYYDSSLKEVELLSYFNFFISLMIRVLELTEDLQ